MTQKFRITYATMSADNEELQAAYDAAAERARAELGKEYPVVVNGEERWHDERYEEPSPIDKDITIGSFSQATTPHMLPLHLATRMLATPSATFQSPVGSAASAALTPVAKKIPE